MGQDKIIRIYSRLSALRQNLPNNYNIHEKYLKEYHEIIDLLEKEISNSLNEFKIPIIEVKPQITGGDYSTGETYYSEDNYCEKSLFLSKLDAILSYFSIAYLSEEKRTIGFHPPEK